MRMRARLVSPPSVAAGRMPMTARAAETETPPIAVAADRLCPVPSSSPPSMKTAEPICRMDESVPVPVFSIS